MVKGQLEFVSDTFQQLKPGLSSYDSDADSAAKSLDPLLKTAVQTVPEELQVPYDSPTDRYIREPCRRHGPW